MEAMRERTKEHFPTVLLTLLSIVQALALEILWSHLVDASYLFEFTWITVLSWIQVSATLIGIVLIWVIYSGSLMRFRWVPTTTDLVFPFFIGLLEFMLVASLGAETLGRWLLFMAAIFAAMNWESHTTMRRARQDKDNEVFFRNVEPATWRDFRVAVYTVGILVAAGVYLTLSKDTGPIAMLLVLVVTGLLLYQFRVSARFWDRSVLET